MTTDKEIRKTVAKYIKTTIDPKNKHSAWKPLIDFLTFLKGQNLSPTEISMNLFYQYLTNKKIDGYVFNNYKIFISEYVKKINGNGRVETDLKKSTAIDKDKIQTLPEQVKNMSKNDVFLTNDNLSLSLVRTISPENQELIESTIELSDNAHSKNTRKAYRTDFNDFVCFCDENGLQAAPTNPETVMLYITYLVKGNKSLSTIRRRVAAIGFAHKQVDAENPITDKVKNILKGAKRKLDTFQKSPSPLSLDVLKKIVMTVDYDDIVDVRDRALLLIGFAGFYRRNELVNIKYRDVKFLDEGVVIYHSDSKTGAMVKAIAYGKNIDTCPVTALTDCCQLMNIYEGTIFRNIDRHKNIGTSLDAQSVSLILKKHCLRVGLKTVDYSAHSLRSGGATQAYRVTGDIKAIMEQGNWKSDIVYRYIKQQQMFENNVSANLGL